MPKDALLLSMSLIVIVAGTAASPWARQLAANAAAATAAAETNAGAEAVAATGPGRQLLQCPQCLGASEPSPNTCPVCNCGASTKDPEVGAVRYSLAETSPPLALPATLCL